MALGLVGCGCVVNGGYLVTTDLGIELPPTNGNREPDPKTTAGAMVEMLRRYYIPDEDRPAWLFATEIDAPGSSGRRADLVCLGVTVASSYKLIGHEIKVNRADVQNELADLTKCDPWIRYCDHWWLVIPHPALIDGLTIPDTWGIMLPPSGRRTRSATIHRQAPKLEPVNQSPALRALASRAHWRLRDERFHHDRAKKRVESLEAQVRQLESDPDSRTRAPSPTRQFVDAVIKDLGGSWDGKTISSYDGRSLTVADVVTALTDLRAVRKLQATAEQGLSVANNHLTTVQAIINRAVADVAAAQKKKSQSD